MTRFERWVAGWAIAAARETVDADVCNVHPATLDQLRLLARFFRSVLAECHQGRFERSVRRPDGVVEPPLFTQALAMQPSGSSAQSRRAVELTRAPASDSRDADG